MTEERDRDFDAISEKDIYLEARDRMQTALSSESTYRPKAKAAGVFREGNQWDNEVRTTVSMDEPQLTINLTDALVRRVVNNIKQQRPRGKAHPVNGEADIDTAEIINGIGRHVEYRSDAGVAYDVAADNQVTMGLGYCRLVAEYVSPDSFDKDLRILPIPDIFTVYMDPSAILPAGGDAMWCLISTQMKRTEYKRLYPRASNAEWNDSGRSPNTVDWESKEEIRLAEYFRIREKSENLYRIVRSDGTEYTRFESELPSEEAMIAVGDQLMEKRESVRKRVEWFRLNGEKVVEREVLPGDYIPVFRAQGNVAHIDGRIYRRGMVAGMEDPQRMVNYGEPLALDTPIPTPKGWTSIGKIAVGDEVFDEAGKAVPVVGMSPIFIHRECYRIGFKNGDSIVADAAHKWTVEERRYAKRSDWWDRKTLTTAELRADQHFIDAAAPIDCADADLPIPPYALGVWLGDGNSATSQFTQSQDDIEEMRQLLASERLNVGAARYYKDRAPVFTVHGMRKLLGDLGLLGNKHIPEMYLRSSVQQRLALLQGLMDTDGSIAKATRQSEFGTTLPALADGISELLASLGIIAQKSVKESHQRLFANGTTSTAKELYRFTFTCNSLPIFRLSRKASLQRQSGHDRRTRRHRIVSIERCESVPVRCLMVDTPTHLFLVGKSMIPTHNTAKVKRLGLAKQSQYMAAEGQLDGHPEWDSREPVVTLTWKPVTVMTAQGEVLLPPPQSLPPAQIEAGFAEFVQGMRTNLMAVAGMPSEPGADTQGTVVSGKAIQRRQGYSDQSHFQYYDNITLMIAQLWRVMLQWIPAYFSTERMQRIIGDDNQPRMVMINEKTSEGGVNKIKHDLSVGQYDVVMDTGPGYETKREEGADNLINLLSIPALAEIIAKQGPDLVFRSIDHPYMQELADRLVAQTPEGLKDVLESMPSRARALIQSMATQIQGLQQKLQQTEMDLKNGITKAHLAATVKAHDVEESNKTKRLDTLSRDQTKIETTKLQIEGKLRDTEIDATGKLLDTHLHGHYDEKAADRMISQGEKAESNGAAK